MQAWPITREHLAEHLGTSPASPVDVAHADRCTAAASRFVERNRPDVRVDTDADGVPDAYPAEVDDDLGLGAVMLAARWYARRGSPAGIAAYGDLGAAYVQRTDPDVAALLGLGRGRVG